jgi:hypothetical protein
MNNAEDAVAEPDLNRLRRTLTGNPLPQRLSLGCADGNREQRVERPVQTRDRGTVTDETLDHLAHLLPRRAHRHSRASRFETHTAGAREAS